MFRRALLVLALVLVPLGVAPLAAPLAASATASTTPLGAIASARQNTFTHRLTVTGWAYVPARSAASIQVRIYVNGRYVGAARANRPSPGADRKRHITGRHAFHFARQWARRAGTVRISAGNPRVTLDRSAVTRFAPSPGQRIISVARRYVGSRYVEDGAGPRGFDCSGYTKYAYRHARVRVLPHNAEAQRRMRAMRHIAKGSARPGDLVFYLSGGRAYHVAIYAGHGMQYAAATPREGVRYQHVWSRNVQYGTTWH